MQPVFVFKMANLSKYIDYKLTHTSLMHFVPPSCMEAPYHGKSAPFHVPDSENNAYI